MINPRNIQIGDYNYDLPDERIAKYPLAQRNQSKLLVWKNGNIEQKHFCDLPELIPAHSMIVFNNTKVIQARLHFRKPTGGIVEVFCLEPESPKDYQQNFAAEHECVWTCLVGNSKKWKEGSLSLDVQLKDGRKTTLYCERAGELGASQKIRFYWDNPNPNDNLNPNPNANLLRPQDARTEGSNLNKPILPIKGEVSQSDGEGLSFAQILDAMGELPIPPYLNRATEEKDKETYQTVYSKIKGSVAAPTAGLHYTDAELNALTAKGVSLQYLTLHVGAGTFKPVKSETIEGHDMHTEFISVPRDVIQSLLNFKLGIRNEELGIDRQANPNANPNPNVNLNPLRPQDARTEGSNPNKPILPIKGEVSQSDGEGLLIATGTTSIRTLESLYYIGEKIQQNPEAHAEELVVHQWEPYDVPHTMSLTESLQCILDYLDAHQMENLVTATQILIAPGFQYRVVDAIVTNFHMPQSTLLLLVSAFVDGDSLEGPNWHRIYRYAMDNDFRFLSYGDSSILFK